jgi:uncharacterized protein YxjI
MSQLYIRQKVFSWKDRFSVKDADGIDRYTAEGELWSLGKKLHVNNMAGEEVAYIQQKVWSFKPRFFVFISGIQTAEVVREITLLRPKYTIHGLDWDCRGDITGHDYEIWHGGDMIVRIHKVWFTWGDSYELDIPDSRNEILALSVVLAIDAVISQARAASASSGGGSSSS